jgi:hypothetical protein
MEKREPWPKAIGKFFYEAEDANPYATSATMRAYDQQLRNAAQGALGQAAAQWRSLAQELAQSIPQPSRDHPFPPADQMQRLKALKNRADTLSQMAAEVTALEVPATDRVHHRVQNATLLLETVIEMDRALLYIMAEVLEAQEMAQLDEKLTGVRAKLQERRQLLREIP